MDQQQRGAAKRQYARVKDFKRMFTTEEGKRVLWELLYYSGFISSTFNKDPYENAYNNGKRDMVGYILMQLRVSEKELTKLLKETDEYATNRPTD